MAAKMAPSAIYVLLMITLLLSGFILAAQPTLNPFPFPLASAQAAAKAYDGTKGYVTIWFEHAFASQRQAMENMSKYGMRASIDVVVQKVGQPGYMTWTELQGWNSNAGFEIMSHSETHLVISDSTPYETLYYEIVQSKLDLQNHGFDPTHYGPPNNVFTAEASELMSDNYKYTRVQPQIPNTSYTINHDGLKYGFSKALHHYGVGNGAALPTFDSVKQVIDSAIQNHTWIVLNFHQIENSSVALRTSPQIVSQILDYIRQKSSAGQLIVDTSENGLGLGSTPSTTYPIIHMSDTTASSIGGRILNSDTPVRVEYVTSSSQLVGDEIDQIIIRLKRIGMPTGMAQVGIFNSDQTVKKLFGTIDADTITPSFSDYTFSLPGSDLYAIQAGDRIGIKFTGGSSSSYISIMVDTDSADPFDGNKTYRQWFTSTWKSLVGQDMYMILKQTHG
jgi:hypothetical protein